MICFLCGKGGEHIDQKAVTFCGGNLIDLNATQAAVRAGYSPKTANEQGSQNLAKLSIQAAIDRAMAERSRRTRINQDRVIDELARIALVNPADVVDADSAAVKTDASREDTACIAGVKIRTLVTKDGLVVEREVKFYDKVRALELLGKHLGLFTDRVKLESLVPVKVCGDIPPDEE